ncbi:hypothetical protein EAD96_30310 [Micromonospora sp. BL1]|uniref:Imm32 family immunity protein n=1 Tax=Micromonospora sp. BL1 TaxID=2478709 RepID=UPI000EF5BCB1|nr:hypothetical protein [Micromonospora sp. BL1]RLP97087.1 hypothetical protein EAD96_30310 [Micromonospora sp. BL1]
MKILFYPPSGEVDISGTAGEYHALAALIVAGSGGHAAEPDATDDFGGTALSGLQVSTSAHRMVLISIDDARGVLQISGASAPLALLASNVEAMAADQGGGHLHIDYFPDHPYLAPTSVSLIVNSPHGGMPTR